MDPSVVQLTTTTPDEATARRIATALLEARLAACVQVGGPIRSTYWWEGAIEESVEWQCVAKTTAAAATGAIEAIRAMHPYDVAEILVTPVLDGNGAYLAWVAETVSWAPGDLRHEPARHGGEPTRPDGARSCNEGRHDDR